MILEEETYEKFGYYPITLKPKSGKTILCTCDECGVIRITRKDSYHNLCRRCAQKGKRSSLFGKKGEESPSWKGGKVKRICQECGKAFLIFPSSVKRGEGMFCSKVCSGKAHSGDGNINWKGGLVKRTCQECGKEFDVKPCEIKKGWGKYCSWSCSNKVSIRMQRHTPMQKKTKPERTFENICERNNISFHFVGDGQLWIGKKGKKQLNPDFIEANGKKVCVEVMGDYWHSPLLNRKIKDHATLKFRRKHFKRYKWHPIFIWESDLKRRDAEAFVLNVLKNENVKIKGE